MHDMQARECIMNAPMKKAFASNGAATNGERPLPPEAFLYDDDVTHEGVELMREMAKEIMDAEEWEIVDSFGLEPA